MEIAVERFSLVDQDNCEPRKKKLLEVVKWKITNKLITRDATAAIKAKRGGLGIVGVAVQGFVAVNASGEDFFVGSLERMCAVNRIQKK